MSMTRSSAVVVAAARTPIGNYEGGLEDLYPEDLIGTILDALVERTGIEPEQWDDFRLGCANQEEEQGRNLARQALLANGYSETIPGVSISRLCGSSLTALNDAARYIESGDGDVVPVVGVEHMSRVSFSDWIPPKVEQRYEADRLAMGQTAEAVAREYGISRQEQDEFALRSHQRAVEAWDAGRFDREVVPVSMDGITLTEDEGPRRDTNLEILSSLSTAFRDDDQATVTAGNSSPLSDGAAGMLVVSEEFAADHGLDILARVGDRAAAGVDPYEMGIGPIPATRKALDKSGLTMNDIDLVELNEAFASQSLYCKEELGIDEEILNVNGGAIALGHPLGCSGIRIATTLVHEMQRQNVQNGLATLCVGFGQGVATILTRV